MLECATLSVTGYSDRSMTEGHFCWTTLYQSVAISSWSYFIAKRPISSSYRAVRRSGTIREPPPQDFPLKQGRNMWLGVLDSTKQSLRPQIAMSGRWSVQHRVVRQWWPSERAAASSGGSPRWWAPSTSAEISGAWPRWAYHREEGSTNIDFLDYMETKNDE